MDRIPLVSLFSTMVLAAGPRAAPAAVLFQEDFEDGVANDFTPWQGIWDVVDGTYHSHVDGFGVLAVSVAGLASGGDGWTDYRAELDIRVDGSINHILAPPARVRQRKRGSQLP